MPYRSAKTGKYISRATATRSPRTTLKESGGRNTRSGRSVHRSAVTGRFVGNAAAKRWPNHTVTEKM